MKLKITKVQRFTLTFKSHHHWKAFITFFYSFLNTKLVYIVEYDVLTLWLRLGLLARAVAWRGFPDGLLVCQNYLVLFV